jgi:hypothetical protein
MRSFRASAQSAGGNEKIKRDLRQNALPESSFGILNWKSECLPFFTFQNA